MNLNPNSIALRARKRLIDARAILSLLPENSVQIPSHIFGEALEELIQALEVTYKLPKHGQALVDEPPTDLPRDPQEPSTIELPWMEGKGKGGILEQT